MKFSHVVLALVVLLGVFAVSYGSVVDLTSQNFDATIKEGKWFVKFFAPWCGHCKRLAPTWDELAEKITGVNIAKVDCTQEREICQSQGIRGYPTLKYFVDGVEGEAYKGQRTIPAFQEFLNGN